MSRNKGAYLFLDFTKQEIHRPVTLRSVDLLCVVFQFTYHGPDPVHKYLTLVVDDGIQPPVELSCKDRNIMAATFIRFLHKNIGESLDLW